MAKYMPLADLRKNMVFPAFAPEVPSTAEQIETHKRKLGPPPCTITLYLYGRRNGHVSRRFDDKKGVKLYLDRLTPVRTNSYGDGWYTMTVQYALSQNWVRAR